MPVNLPLPPSVYDPLYETRRNEAIRVTDSESHKKTADIDVGARHRGGVITPLRIVLTSPNGNRHAVSVDNAGALVVTEL